MGYKSKVKIRQGEKIMNIREVGTQKEGLTQAKNKQNEAVLRVQTEFLNQISEGKCEKEAFLQSLKAIDEKYNLEKDTVKFETQTVCAKKITPDTAMKWLDVIATAVPIIIKFVDWILEKFPSCNNNQPHTEEFCCGSTTA